MRVLYVSPLAERGGVEVVLLNILKALDRSRLTAGVALLQDGPLVSEVRSTGVPVWVAEAGRVRQITRGVRAVARLARLIRQERIDLVHTMNAKAHLYGGWAAALRGVPCVYHLHGVPRPSLGRDGLVSALSVALPAARTIACSEFVADSFRKAWRSRRAVKVVRNGLMATGAAPSPGQVRAEFRIPDAAPLIVMVARLQRGKGIHVFIDAAAQVARSRPDARFLVVGGALFGLEPRYALELRQRVATLGLDGAVAFTGHRPDVERFFAAADVVVHAAIEPEAFGMVLVEAMACGKPVIASDSGGPREIVQDGVTGLLVRPGDAARFAQAILTLLGDERRRLRMGQAGSGRVRELFSAERMVRQLEDLYQEMVGTHSIA